MTDQGTRVMEAARRLREAVEGTADALGTSNLEGLLAGEAALERALAALPASMAVPGPERPLVRAELEAARDALMRARRLGITLTEFIRLSFEAQGRTSGYGPRESVPAFAGRALDTRM